MKKKIEKEDKNSLIVIGAIVLFIIIAISVYIVSNPFNTLTPEEEQKIEGVKEIYKEQGIEINDEDISLEKDSEEGLKITVNEDKRAKAMANSQKSLDNLISKYTGISAPNRNEASNNDDNQDQKKIFITLSDAVNIINSQLSSLNDYLNRSLAYNAENYSYNYVEYLLKQRQTGDPSSDSPFIVSMDDTMTYANIQKKLNCQSFLAVNYPDFFSTEEKKNFYLWSMVYSDNLYNNILNTATYENQYSLDSDISVIDGDFEEFSYVDQGGTVKYNCVAIIKIEDKSFKMGMKNKEFMLLDVS